jgi:hypothetical protein
MKLVKSNIGAALVAAALVSLSAAAADPVPLQSPTATFSQTIGAPFTVDKAVDGVAGDLGWAVFPQNSDQTAVFETGSDVGFAGGSLWTFTLSMTHSNPGHTLGRFRLSITRDDRTAFADGKATGGAVDAKWTVLDPLTFLSRSGATLTKLPDHSLLVSGPNPATDVYTVTALTRLTSITGVRLEALTHESLPHNGPGRLPENGNFVLTEFQATITPTNLPPVLEVYSAVEICFPTAVGRTYQIQWAPSLDAATWTDLGPPVAGTGAEECLFDSVRTRQRRFYRVLESP